MSRDRDHHRDTKPSNPLRARCKRLLDRVTGEEWPWVGVDEAAAWWGGYEQVEAVLQELADGMDDRTGTGVA